MSSVALKRLESLWELGPIELPLLRHITSTWVRAGYPQKARARLVEAIQEHGISPKDAAEIAGPLSLGRWWGTQGAAPFRTSLSPCPDALQSKWLFKSSHKDERFGLPPCVRSDRVILVAQSVVVGMRFVRLIGIDAHTGKVCWEQERRRITRPTAPVWLGGEGSTERVAWAYSIEEGDDFVLCLEQFDPSTGRSLRLEEQRLQGATITTPASILSQLSPSHLGWLVEWIDEEQRHRKLFKIDRETGCFSETIDLSLGPESIVERKGVLYGVDDAGMSSTQALQRRSLRPFKQTEYGAVIEGEAPNEHLFEAGGKLYFYEPEFIPQPPSMRVLVRRNHPVSFDLTKNSFEVVLERGRRGSRYLCASPGGEVFVFRRQDREHGEIYALSSKGGVRFVCALPRLSHSFSNTEIRGVWMGGALLLKLRSSTTSHFGEIIALDAQKGTELWRYELLRAWHRGPIPCGTGLIGLYYGGAEYLVPKIY